MIAWADGLERAPDGAPLREIVQGDAYAGGTWISPDGAAYKRYFNAVTRASGAFEAMDAALDADGVPKADRPHGRAAGGRRLFESLGFQRHKRELFYIESGALRLSDVHRRLQLDDALVTDVCWRRGLTRASAENVIGR